MKVSGTVVAIASALAGGCGGATGTSGTGGAGGSMGPGAAGRGDVGAAGAGGRGGTSVGGAGTGGSMAGTAGAGSAGASGTGGRGGGAGGTGGGASGTGGGAPSDCGPGSGLDPMAAWPTMGRCYARRAATSVLSVQKPVIAWSQAIGVASDIAIGRDGTLYFGKSTTGGGYVLQAVRSDGTQAWSID